MTFQMRIFSYKEQKIKRILQAMEAEMGFPAFLYDFVEEEAYYSSMNFQKIAKGFGLETEDFWERQCRIPGIRFVITWTW